MITAIKVPCLDSGHFIHFSIRLQAHFPSSKMRFNSILLVAVAGLVTCDSIAAATPGSIQEKGDATIDEATFRREISAYDQGGRFLRAKGR
jgi:hypothetical protein